MSRTALVTGDKGFLGRHFAAELRARGYQVTGVDVERADSQDVRVWLETKPARRDFDLVVHAAAVVGGREKIDGSPLETAVNLEIDAALFRWAAKQRPGRVLYFSSSAAYPVMWQGEQTHRRLEESDVLLPHTVHRPDQVYGWSKVIGEVLADKLRAAGVGCTVVRPFSGYGTDQSLDYPFPSFIARALRQDDPFELWCGSCVRDFVHVDDIVGAALAMCDDRLDGPFNICSGRPVQFGELARMVCELAGYAPTLNVLGDKPSGVAYRVGDPAAMRRFWEPKVTLEDGIRRALAGEL